MPLRYNTVDTGYDESRTSDRWREPRVQEVPTDRIDFIRRRELASFYGQPVEAEKSLVLRRHVVQDQDEEDYYANRRLVRRERFSDDTNLPRPDYRKNDELQRSSRNRDQSPPSKGDSYRSDGRRSRRHRRARSEQRDDNCVQTRRLPQNKDKLGLEEEDDGGLLWYSAKKRNEATFLEKHFDSSYDGLGAAVVGAAIGAMGVNRLHLSHHGATEAENRAIAAKGRWKTIGGAVAGAVAFNAAENWFRIYTEEKLEHRENILTGLEFCGEVVDGLV